jgi:hypothetical protein
MTRAAAIPGDQGEEHLVERQAVDVGLQSLLRRPAEPDLADLDAAGSQ